MKKELTELSKKQILVISIICLIGLLFITLSIFYIPTQNITTSYHSDGFQSKLNTITINKFTGKIERIEEHDDDTWKKYDNKKSIILTRTELSKLISAYDKTNGKPGEAWYAAIFKIMRENDQCDYNGTTCRELGNKILDNYLETL